MKANKKVLKGRGGKDHRAHLKDTKQWVTQGIGGGEGGREGSWKDGVAPTTGGGAGPHNGEGGDGGGGDRGGGGMRVEKADYGLMGGGVPFANRGGGALRIGEGVRNAGGWGVAEGGGGELKVGMGWGGGRRPEVAELPGKLLPPNLVSHSKDRGINSGTEGGGGRSGYGHRIIQLYVSVENGRNLKGNVKRTKSPQFSGDASRGVWDIVRSEINLRKRNEEETKERGGSTTRKEKVVQVQKKGKKNQPGTLG